MVATGSGVEVRVADGAAVEEATAYSMQYRYCFEKEQLPVLPDEPLSLLRDGFHLFRFATVVSKKYAAASQSETPVML